MVKITFEVSEDFIRESTKPENAADNIINKNGFKALKGMLDVIAFSQLKKMVDDGKTEFVVTPEKLDSKSKTLLDMNIGEICMLAVFSEMDDKDDE